LPLITHRYCPLSFFQPPAGPLQGVGEHAHDSLLRCGQLAGREPPGVKPAWHGPWANSLCQASAAPRTPPATGTTFQYMK
jgi:hypothetical protein